MFWVMDDWRQEEAEKLKNKIWIFKLNKKLNPDPVSQVTERRYQGEAVETKRRARSEENRVKNSPYRNVYRESSEA